VSPPAPAPSPSISIGGPAGMTWTQAAGAGS
jgi:hypothetical protein